MRKNVSKLLSLAVCGVMAFGVAAAAGCSTNFKSKPLTGSLAGDVTSNGGFAVKKGDYVYFVNGVADQWADNTYGTPVKGAIMRIHKDDLAQGKYQNVDTVVPQMAFSNYYQAGIYVYGDRVYYATPSTAKNSNGEIQNSLLEFKSAKLDGTEAMKDYYLQVEDVELQYRYVEVNDVVYLLYAITEDAFETGTETTNLHAVNLSTKEDTLLVYNAQAITFDTDATNPNVYYTMQVDVNGGDYLDTSLASYNQIYVLNAAATLNKDDAKQYAKFVDADGNETVKYVNAGKLIIDGIGKGEQLTAQNKEFDASKTDAQYSAVQTSNFNYTIKSVNNGDMVYARSISNTLSETFRVNALAETVGDALNGNSNVAYMQTTTYDKLGSSYLFVNDAKITTSTGAKADVIYLDSTGSTKAIYKANVVNGELTNVVPVAKGMTDLTIYNVSEQQLNGDSATRPYLYYADGTTNGNSVCRIALDGSYADYAKAQADLTDHKDFTAVKLLDVSGVAEWYLPEFIDGQVLFASDISANKMENYNYVQVCDLHVRGGNALMSNQDMIDLNETYENILKDIDSIEETNAADEPTEFANLRAVETYYFYSIADKSVRDAYMQELFDAYVDISGYTKDQIRDELFSNAAQDALNEFADTTKNKTHTINYFYQVLGQMSEEDAEALEVDVRIATVNVSIVYPIEEEKEAWFSTLSTVEKVFFIIGVCAGGLLVLGGATWLTVRIVKANSKKLPSYVKAKHVDMTDDQDIDVYESDEEAPADDE